MNNFETLHTSIICEDEYRLAATIYSPESHIKGAVLMGPATGIKRQFYVNFASFLAEKGYGVITFDNRGIGESISGHVKNSTASLQCWGEKDMTAALKQLQTAFPNTTYHLAGHSAGGQLIGLMPNAKNISSVFNVACSSGQLSNMSKTHQIKAHFFMNFFIPLSNLLFGHTKSQWVGMGEPLPKRVSQQWREFCNGEGYVKTAFGNTIHQHLYDDLTMLSLWINASDDEIANNANVADMLSVFTKMNAETLTLTPKDYGLHEIGHMKFFSRKSEKLWEKAIHWFEKHTD